MASGTAGGLWYIWLIIAVIALCLILFGAYMWYKKRNIRNLLERKGSKEASFNTVNPTKGGEVPRIEYVGKGEHLGNVNIISHDQDNNKSALKIKQRDDEEVMRPELIKPKITMITQPISNFEKKNVSYR